MKNILLLLIVMLWGCQTTNAPNPQDGDVPIPASALPAETMNSPLIDEPVSPRFLMENMMNLAPETVQNILGEPSLIRTEKDVHVWLYHNTECVLHLYFYPNDNGDYRLDYTETAGIGLKSLNPTVSPNACLDSFITIPQTP
ncbi:MAG: hypothetical protein K9G26_00845 [Emcibacter sp.]|nr:hypothetical protein [Emcibacter sp.]